MPLIQLFDNFTNELRIKNSFTGFLTKQFAFRTAPNIEYLICSNMKVLDIFSPQDFDGLIYKLQNKLKRPFFERTYRKHLVWFLSQVFVLTSFQDVLQMAEHLDQGDQLHL
jgi:hypothetical protein